MVANNIEELTAVDESDETEIDDYDMLRDMSSTAIASWFFFSSQIRHGLGVVNSVVHLLFHLQLRNSVPTAPSSPPRVQVEPTERVEQSPPPASIAA